ncbi:BTAD domain-containing putative transcriptional regulator [Streptomyces albidoflavus]
MDVSVLGRLDVRVDDVSVTPTAPKPRQVLALLALRADTVVSVALLTEELWGTRPPRSARATLQTYVLQLRGLIGAALRQRAAHAGACSAKEVLATTPDGYLLDTGGGRSDVREFELLAVAGRQATEAGDWSAAAHHLRTALSLWTGPALAGVRSGTVLSLEARRLEETRLCALIQRIDADLRLGHHRSLLSELSVLVGRHPTDETLHAQFMLALHRSGRRPEALQAYQRLRRALVDELGLEPSAALQRMQRHVLTDGAKSGARVAAADGVKQTVPAG